MFVILRRAALVLVVCAAVILGAGAWLLSRPLPEVQPPPIDEAKDVPTGDLSEYQRQVYMHLREGSIKSVSPHADEVYRLILLPTFDEPVVVRITKTGEHIQLTKKIFDGVGGYGVHEMGNIAVDQTRDITSEDFVRFRKLLADAEFWGLPQSDPDDGPVNDGALWIMEVRDRGVTRSVERITPRPKLLSVFRYVLKLAGVEERYMGYWPD